MERVPVTSSNIRSIGYDPANQILEVEFDGGSVYQYADVPQSEFEGFMKADSKGKYLHMNIKGRYGVTKL